MNREYLGLGSEPVTGEQPSASLPDRAYSAVEVAWRDAVDRRDWKSPTLETALRSLARQARRRGVPMSAVLRALNGIVRPEAGGDSSLDADGMREWAGTVVITAYYHHD